MLHGTGMDIRASQAFLITQAEPKVHRWALVSEWMTAVCLKARADFPDVASVIDDMAAELWLCHRHDVPDHFSLLQGGRVRAQVSASPPPLELSMFARMLDELSEDRTPAGCTLLPIWALTGVTGDWKAEH